MRYLLLIVVLSAMLSSACVHTPEPRPLRLGDPVAAPTASRGIDVRDRTDCPYGVVTAVAGMLNNLYWYTDDMETCGRIECWRHPSEAINRDGLLRGDCDDHAVAAVTVLRVMGFPARAAIVCTETGGYHAVAVCGGHVIDSRHPEGAAISELEYEWVAASRAEIAGEWARVKE